MVRIKKSIWRISIILAFSIFLLLFAKDASAPSNQEQPNSAATDSSQQSSFDKKAHALDEPDSIWWIVSKVRPLNPISYAPSDLVVPNIPLRASRGDGEMRLRQETAVALEEMVAAAKVSGIKLLLASGYRSYQLQVSVYNGYVQQEGQAWADKYSARPGTSEHQTGLAVDLGAASRQCELEICFADLPEGKWLAVNAYLYGFVIRYPEGKYEVTGYEFEPWHFRYVGKELSAELHKQNIQTLEEFFGVVPNKQPY